MSAVPIRSTRTARAAALALATLLTLTIQAEAVPLGAAMTGIATFDPPATLVRPDIVPSPFALSHSGRLKRMRHELVRMRRARATRLHAARAELAQMQRKGQEFCLATAVYFEARDEPIKGQHAVAAVILARTKVPGRPRTVCGVVFQGAWRKTGCQFSFACDGRSDVPRWRARWLRAQRSAAYVWRHQRGTRSIVRGATFYHTKFVHPRWDKQMVRVARIGLHYFYKPRHGRLS